VGGVWVCGVCGMYVMGVCIYVCVFMCECANGV